MLEQLGDFLRDMLAAAVEDAAMMVIVNDGPPARFVAHDPTTGDIMGAFVPHGETVRVNRSYRLLVEDVDRVRIRPLCCVSSSWVTT